MENLEELISQISKIVLTEKTQQEERSKRGGQYMMIQVKFTCMHDFYTITAPFLRTIKYI